MRVAVLRLQSFRSYAEAEFRPASGTTVVWGSNGAGKSNLMEAIGLFSTLSSPRAGHLGVLIRRGFEEAGARLETDNGTALEVRLRGGRTMLRAGGSGTVARSFLGRFRSVLFTPEDLDMVRGEPELRRRALDDLIVQLRPAFRGIRQAYDRALRQRNRALRHGWGADAACYDGPLAEAGAQILDARRRVLDQLIPRATELYEQLAGRGKLAIHYKDSSGDDRLAGSELIEHLRERHAEGLQTDLERGTTRVGPHRDDIELFIDEAPARHFGSRGEQRSVALAWRMSQLTLLRGAVLLLDDVLSELDADRRARLFEAARGSQVIVATADRSAIPAQADVQAEWAVRDGGLHVGR